MTLKFNLIMFYLELYLNLYKFTEWYKSLNVAYFRLFYTLSGSEIVWLNWPIFSRHFAQQAAWEIYSGNVDTYRTKLLYLSIQTCDNVTID